MNSSSSLSSSPRTFSRRDFIKSTGAFAILAGWGGPFARQAGASAMITPQYHFLNRISWGVRASDLHRLSLIGIPAYLEEQLDPARLPGVTRVRVPSVLNLDRRRAARLRNASDVCELALVQGMLSRAATSPAQLLERMVEFWSDHFNISSEELEPDSIDFQRRVIRPNALGNFKTMLIAAAKHPAMLQYLDNYLNIAAHPNENYAREVMELHTLGVDGGYTEADVKAVARALTGWTIDDSVAGFFFEPDDHDMDAKTVLGTPLAAGRGIEDGMDVLNLLANHASTAHFVCRKLCVRFVSDNPPASLVNAITAVWIANNGEIKPVLRALFNSTEFANATGQKLRRPLDFFVGCLRTTGATVTNIWVLYDLLSRLAQTPYDWHPPNGYPDVAGAWANANGLLERWNAAQVLTDSALNERGSGVRSPLYSLVRATTAGALVDQAALLIFGTPLDPDKRAEMVAFVTDGGPETTKVTRAILIAKLGSLCGLLLSSPMFQWR